MIVSPSWSRFRPDCPQASCNWTAIISVSLVPCASFTKLNWRQPKACDGGSPSEYFLAPWLCRLRGPRGDPRRGLPTEIWLERIARHAMLIREVHDILIDRALGECHQVWVRDLGN